MEVVDHKPNYWYLLKEDESFYLDGNYNHSFIGYSFTIRLTSDEKEKYKDEGATYLSNLSDEIQDTAPILKISTSHFKGREIKGKVAEDITQAIVKWRNAHEEASPIQSELDNA